MTHYPTSRGVMYPISKMSKAYLINIIARINKTQLDIEYLPYLKEELRIKSIIRFINLPTDEC